MAIASASAGAHTYHLLHNEPLCDPDERVCLHGWLVHNPHNNQIELSARIQRSGEPGTITIFLVGETPGKHRVSTSLTLEVRGDYSEILSAKIAPQWPHETRWDVETLHFEPVGLD